MNISVLAWFGHGNFGDELFKDAYKQLFPKDRLHFFTDKPGLEVPLIDFDFVNKCDLFILGGGELINRNSVFLPPNWVPKIRVPKMILGCGVNAKKPEQISLKTYQELHCFNYIGLRDAESVKLLYSFEGMDRRVGLFYDLAYSLDLKNIVPKESEERIEVVIPTDRFSNQSDYGILQHNVVKHSLKWLRTNLLCADKAIFLPFGKEDNNDYETCVRLAEKLDIETEIVKDCLGNKQATLQTIANALGVVSYRLHGLILSRILNKPYDFYPYHHKLNRVYNSTLGCSPDAIRQWQRYCLDSALTKIFGGSVS